MTKTIRLFGLFAALLTAILSNAQTNPTPFNLESSGNYSFSSWPSSSATGTYPSNMRFHLMNATNPTVTAVAQSDLLTGYLYSYTSGTRIQGLGTSGVQFQNATTPTNTGYTANKLGEAVVGINTSNRTSIAVSWKGQTRTTAGNVSAIRLQYRIGSTGAYSDFSPISEFVSSASTTDSTVMNVNLPSNLENQSLVHLRWIYYKVSGSSSSSRTIRLDDISITSLPDVTLSQPSDVCINAAPFVIADGAPSGGVYSGTGVVGGNTFDPSVSGAGTFLLTYTYTDANNISNSASRNITVSAAACVIPIGLAPQSCGATGLLKNSYIYTEVAPGAQDYEYEFSGGDLGSPVTRKRTNNLTDFNLGWLPQLNYGQTYNVRVHAKVSNIWGAFANTCTVGLAASSPTPQLKTTSCGATGLSMNSYIYTTSIASAQDYEYRFLNTTTQVAVTRARGNGNTDLNLGWVSGLTYGVTYDVTVRAKVNNVWGSFGNVCQITTMTFPMTNLTTASCGITGLVKANKIYCNPVVGATNYQYEFTPPSGPVIVKSRGGNFTDLTMSTVTGIMPGTTYTVVVRAYVSGWGTYGTPCTISTASNYNAVIGDNNSETRITGPDFSEGLTVTLYPNPNSGDVVSAVISGSNGAAMIRVYDLSGRMVTAMQSASSAVDLNVANLEAGMYLVEVVSGEQKITQKLIINR